MSAPIYHRNVTLLNLSSYNFNEKVPVSEKTKLSHGHDLCVSSNIKDICSVSQFRFFFILVLAIESDTEVLNVE